MHSKNRMYWSIGEKLFEDEQLMQTWYLNESVMKMQDILSDKALTDVRQYERRNKQKLSFETHRCVVGNTRKPLHRLKAIWQLKRCKKNWIVIVCGKDFALCKRFCYRIFRQVVMGRKWKEGLMKWAIVQPSNCLFIVVCVHYSFLTNSFIPNNHDTKAVIDGSDIVLMWFITAFYNEKCLKCWFQDNEDRIKRLWKCNKMWMCSSLRSWADSVNAVASNKSDEQDDVGSRW